MKSFNFDQDYYRRFYHDRRTRVVTQASVALLGRFVCSYVKYLGLPVESVVDLGCGLGYWRPVIARHFRKARYTGVEISTYLCRQHGWIEGSVVDFRPPPGVPARFDLVICQGVLQYLPNGQARKAIANLARLCGGVLYLEALTRGDWERNCDQAVTDGTNYLRPVEWYRAELARRFIPCGGGLFVARRAPVTLFELETLG